MAKEKELLCICLFDYGLYNICRICTLFTFAQVLSVATKDETLHCEILYEEVTALRILFILLDLDNQFACLFCLPYMSSFPVALFPSHNVQ